MFQSNISVTLIITLRYPCSIDTLQCDHSIVSRAVVAMLPAYFRMAQCLRRYRDSKEAFPHLANAGKLEIRCSYIARI